MQGAEAETVETQADLRRAAFADANDWLNALVRRKVARMQAAGEVLPAEIQWVSERQHDVYQRRFKPMVLAVIVGSLFGMLQAPSMASLLLAFVLLYFLIDFYSGVLHVVLDNPRFVRLPLMGVPCVEFQWHHTFSHDIASRRLLDVWGDLNVLLIAKLLCLVVLAGISSTSMMVAGVGFFWGYANQWSHRLTHSPAAKRPRVAQWLQRHGVLLAPSTHHLHHVDHSVSFPVLSGHSRRLVQWLLGKVPNQWAWLGFFLLLTAFDLAAVVWLLDWAGIALGA